MIIGLRLENAERGAGSFGGVPFLNFAGLTVAVLRKNLLVELFHIVIEDFHGDFWGKSHNIRDQAALESDLNLGHGVRRDFPSLRPREIRSRPNATYRGGGQVRCA